MSKTKISLIFKLLIVFCFLIFLSGNQQAYTRVENIKQSYENRLLVRYKEKVSPEEARSKISQKKGRVIREYKIVKNLFLVEIEDKKSLKRAVKEFRKDKNVIYAEPDYTLKPARIPDDPHFSLQWALNNTGQTIGGIAGKPDADIDAVEAWDLTTGSANIVVAVIDTGVDYTHPDISQNVWHNPFETPGNGIDDDRNGYIDDIYGIDTANGDSNPMDDDGHGTHVAGIIGAVGNNSRGICGINWNVKIMALKFMGSNGYGSVSGAIECLEYASATKKKGVPVVLTNNSWSGINFSQALYDAIQAQLREGILFVVAAGNDGENTDENPVYPACYDLPNVITVAATDNNDEIADYSNFGRNSVHIAAPGNDIISLYPGGRYEFMSGTSMAAPHVSGVIALLKEMYPGYDWKHLRNRVISSGDDIQSLTDKVLSGGRLNAYRALTADKDFFKPFIPDAHMRKFTGKPFTVRAFSIKGGEPLGPVYVSIKETSETYVLGDNGIEPDLVEGDGLYAGQVTIYKPGKYTLVFTNGAGQSEEIQVDVRNSFIYKVEEGGTTGLTYQSQARH